MVDILRNPEFFLSNVEHIDIIAKIQKIKNVYNRLTKYHETHNIKNFAFNDLYEKFPELKDDMDSFNLERNYNNLDILSFVLFLSDIGNLRKKQSNDDIKKYESHYQLALNMVSNKTKILGIIFERIDFYDNDFKKVLELMLE